MNWLTQLLVELRVRFAALLSRGALRDHVEEEMRFHIDMRAARLVQSGIPPERAQMLARRRR
jgi:hypothetical protein